MSRLETSSRDGVDVGIQTGEPFGYFVYWAVKTHPKGRFSDDYIQGLIRTEFPHRLDRSKWPDKKHRTYQSIPEQRIYANQPFEFGKNSKLGIKDEQHGIEVIARITQKMQGLSSPHNTAADDVQDLALKSHITSRGAVSEDAEELENTPWFNMWSRRQWPYTDINRGDILYWYSASRQVIVWKSIITKLERFDYRSKDEARTKLLRLINIDPVSDHYFLGAAEQGYCLFYRVSPLQKLELPKPSNWDFPRLGWLKATDERAAKWLVHDTLRDLDAVLCPVAADIVDPPPERISCSTYRILRDTELARRVKKMHKFRCQICGERLELQNGSYYAEAHHLKPLGSPHDGPDKMENIVCLCPNHHAALDYGAIRIGQDTFRKVEGHSVSNEFIEYHNAAIYAC